MSIGIKKVRKNGKTYTYSRNYVQEYGERTSQQKDNRSVRRRARTSVIKKLGKAAVAGKDVDHIRGIKGGNGSSNLRVTSVSFNRGRKSTRWR